MIFHKTPIEGCHTIELERREDERGFFARAFDREVFAELGLEADVIQANISHNVDKATLRGMHFQNAPHAEAKLIRCVRGSVHDVIVDIRRNSPSFGKWYGADLSADNHLAMYAPPGTAHGFITLEDNTELLYQVSAAYTPGAEGGVRWDDPCFAIDWPIAPEVISAKDATWPDFSTD